MQYSRTFPKNNTRKSFNKKPSSSSQSYHQKRACRACSKVIPRFLSGSNNHTDNQLHSKSVLRAKEDEEEAVAPIRPC